MGNNRSRAYNPEGSRIASLVKMRKERLVLKIGILAHCELPGDRKDVHVDTREMDFRYRRAPRQR